MERNQKQVSFFCLAELCECKDYLTFTQTCFVRSCTAHLQFLIRTVQLCQPRRCLSAPEEDRDRHHTRLTIQIPPASGWFTGILKIVTLCMPSASFLPGWADGLIWQWPVCHSAGVTNDPCTPAGPTTGFWDLDNGQKALSHSLSCFLFSPTEY